MTIEKEKHVEVTHNRVTAKLRPNCSGDNFFLEEVLKVSYEKNLHGRNIGLRT